MVTTIVTNGYTTSNRRYLLSSQKYSCHPRYGVFDDMFPWGTGETTGVDPGDMVIILFILKLLLRYVYDIWFKVGSLSYLPWFLEHDILEGLKKSKV